MLTDWIHWLLSRTTEDLFWMFLPFMLFDGMRYTFAMACMTFFDVIRDSFRWFFPKPEFSNDYCPSVAVMIVGLNEGDTIEHALDSIYGTYPRMEIFVVDDGSTDGMAEKAMSFARKHRGVTVLSRTERGGKSSAMNMPLPMINSEIVVVLDSDSHLAEGAIWHVVQPFRDPKVGAVSGCVASRNPFVSLCTFLQAFEYRRSIFVGRIFLSRLDILGIISGALGAFRKEALDRVGGWDVGPGEDGDLTIKFRKCGYRIVFKPEAACLTNTPTAWSSLTRQRRRWEWAAITFECRKHVDVGNPMMRNFQWRDFFMVMERWLFNFILVYASVFYWMFLFYTYDIRTICYLTFTFYATYLICELFQLIILLYYSPTPKSDLVLGLASPLMPIYYAYQKLVTFWAISEELLFRRSFRDNFVPKRVREATWHW